ncbi:alginate lyase-domain-containing protein [Irpex lacteus]|nr:alginate lyase-domain-containing protein [Irpex lacteus]
MSALFNLLILATVIASSTHTYAYVNYANDFVDPDYILAGNFSETTLPAQNTIRQWAEDSAAGGPWSVTSKPYLAPSGDKHDYMSFSPYHCKLNRRFKPSWWPNCTGVGNTTELTPQQIWTTCPYYPRDGQFNPDARTVNNIGDFDSMSNAVLFNSLAWGISPTNTSRSTYSSRVTTWIKAWFLDADTYMNPNLNYAQMQRGPGADGQVGTHTGILDLKGMTKLTSGVLILRGGNAPEWTSDVDGQFTDWVKRYIEWLETAGIAIQEKNSTNNHGSFYYNQLAALQVLVDDKAGAQKTLDEYFDGIYMGQIAADGDQPLESIRTRPYHYRAYNLAAMITNARIATYLSSSSPPSTTSSSSQTSYWNRPTTHNATIQSAALYAMAQPAGSEDPTELYPDVAAVASVYGDPEGTYVEWLKGKAGSAFVGDASFLWDQPCGDAGFAAGLVKNGTNSTDGSKGSGSGSGSGGETQAQTSGVDLRGWRAWGVLYAACGVVMAVSFLEFL